MKRMLAALLVMPVAAVAADFHPSIPPTPQSDLACPFRHSVAEVESLRALPAPIQEFVLSKTGAMSHRGAFFNTTDAVAQEAPFHRFIRAGRSGRLWFVWFEQGGIVYNKQLAIFSLDDDAKAQLKFHVDYFEQNPCKVTDSLLDGDVPKDLPFGDDAKDPHALW
ncbi:MAG TPA: hypothetical protein VLV55_12555 [Rhizomicrobium sp.]|nr:hypothetical protein [Rhizomicrobium sp.]